jgi:outer membrane protein OmpA-like peptidoglycan-associated protein
MSHQKHAPIPEEKGESAPLWMVSFADMISLLMAFFLMLLTMANEKSGLLCNEGTGLFSDSLYGFRRSMGGFGIRGLYGAADQGLALDSLKVYYPISDGNDPGVTRTVDARQERTRRVFRQLESRSRTYQSQIQGRRPDFFVLPIAFAQGQSALNPSVVQSLSAFAGDLKGFAPVDQLNVYVVGLAPDVADARQQWLVSARRAQAVADFLQEHLPSGTSCRIFSWGAAQGGDWVKKVSPISQGSHIAIALLKTGD